MSKRKISKEGLARTLKAAHAPEARAKAVASIMATAAIRKKVAVRYGLSSTEFMQTRLLATVERLKIPLADIPVELFKPFPVKQRNKLLAQRANGGNGHGAHGGNGHDKIVAAHGEFSFPLDAIPERKKYERHTAYQVRVGNPNGPIVEKILDKLVPARISEQYGTRVLYVIDKLLSG
jgi:hypothetical protein